MKDTTDRLSGLAEVKWKVKIIHISSQDKKYIAQEENALIKKKCLNLAGSTPSLEERNVFSAGWSVLIAFSFVSGLRKKKLEFCVEIFI